VHEWYYVTNAQQQGPVSESELIDLLRNAQITQKTLVWMQDMKNWLPADQVKALQPQTAEPDSIKPAVDIFEKPVISSACSEEEIFLHIPISRLVVLSILSCGLYEVYWIYKNWRYLKERDNLNIKPFWRAIFGVFYCHSLLKEIHQDKELNLFEPPTFSAGTIATIWVALTLIANFTGNINVKTDIGIDANILAIITFLNPSFLCFIPIQKYINSANIKRNPTAPYTKWTKGHLFCLGLGLFIWISTFMDMADPTMPQEPESDSLIQPEREAR